MKYVHFYEDGSCLLEKEFFTEYMEKNDLIQFTVTIEKKLEHVTFSNPKLKRD
jgi:hypothetical protein